jgi:hypothetical protein
MRKISKRHETGDKVKQWAKTGLSFVAISLFLAKCLDASQSATIPGCECVEHIVTVGYSRYSR